MKNTIKKRISVSVTILFLFLSTLVLLTGCTKNVILNNFSADQTFFLVGEKGTITFTVEATNAKSVDLYSSNETKVNKMLDNGQNGDVIANDGIYTCVLDIEPKQPETIDYYVKCTDVVSEIITISYFEKPSEEAKQEYLDVQRKLCEIEQQYIDDSGYVPKEDIPEAIEGAAEYAKELQESGVVLSYEVTESSITIKFINGLTSVYAPEIEGTYSVGNDVSMEIVIYQPYYDWVSTLKDDYIQLPIDFDNEAELLMGAATDVSSEFENYSFSNDTTYINDEVSIDTIKKFDANQIILWQGHGVYGGEDIHSLICTGSEFDWEAWLWDLEYFFDCCEERIVYYNGDETISHKFIDKYCGDLENSLIYLGPCQSGYDSALADSFLNKGASAVIANTDTILCLYGDMIEYTTIHTMSQVNSETKNYYTLEEALNYAKSLYGKSDIQYGGFGAEPTIFGGDSAKQYRLGDYVPTYVQDFSILSEPVITVGELNVFELQLNPANADQYSVVWTSSNEDVATITSAGDSAVIHAKSKGETTITATLTSGEKTITKTTNLRVASKGRDTVLVLDISGSMWGTPMQEMKEAAIDFCKELLGDEYNNRVGIVFYDDEITTIPLTDDLDGLISYIERVNDGGLTNMEAGIATAKEMLDQQRKSDSIKNIVIMADGLPNDGKTSHSGSMTTTVLATDETFSYANAVIDTAQEAAKKYNLYSLGFFHGLWGDSLQFAADLMTMLTNQEDGYHQVEEAENLQFAFGDISEEISDGSKIVINIACPVDVTIKHNGEILSSAASNYNDKTSFGTLQLLGSNQDIKVLTLEPDVVYNVELTGTGEGHMNYSVNYLDENEEMIDSREFIAVPITSRTRITSNTSTETENMDLNIDKDGDGEIDTIWSAAKYKIGEITYEREPEPIEEEEDVEVPETQPDPTPQYPSNDVETWEIVLIAIGVFAFAGIIVEIVLICLPKSEQRDEDLEERYIEKKVKENEQQTEENELAFAPSVSILNGPLAGAEIPVKDKEIIYVGKDSKIANIVFSGDYPLISRLHCSVMYDSKYRKYFVTDSSTNGTYYLNGVKLEKGKRTVVEPGTVLVLANDKAKIMLR